MCLTFHVADYTMLKKAYNDHLWAMDAEFQKRDIV